MLEEMNVSLLYFIVETIRLVKSIHVSSLWNLKELESETLASASLGEAIANASCDPGATAFSKVGKSVRTDVEVTSSNSVSNLVANVESVIDS